MTEVSPIPIDTWDVIAQKTCQFYEALVYPDGFRETQV